MLDRILMGSSAEASDPNFKNVTLLLHGDGSNGAQNNTFIDSSTNNFTITRNGNTTQGSFSPYGSNWSNYFDGTGDYLTQSSVTLGSGSFTVEMWVYLTSLPNGQNALFSCGTSDGSTNCIWYIDSSGILKFYTSGDQATASIAVSLNQWTHIAIVRNGSSLTQYINGTASGTGTTSRNFSSTPFQIMQGFGGITASPVGYVSNFRVVVGTAVYTANFTPSTTPLTAITNTSLLTCADNRFRDGSTNNFTITRNGDVKVTNFSPFAPSAAYSTSANGGSVYGDGSGDGLTVSTNAAFAFGTGDFTIEFWGYYPGWAGDAQLVGAHTAFVGFDFLIQQYGSGAFRWLDSSLTLSSGFVPSTSSWHHFAVTRSGTTLRIFVDGDLKASGTSTANISSTYKIGILCDSGGSASQVGYMNDVRIVKGTAVYTASFTPPTTPLGAISGTSLLLRGTNAAIFDNSMKNDLETVGNAQISTSVKKFGTGSMAFDGNGDYLVGPNNPLFNFRTGDFTIEWWMYCQIDWSSMPNTPGVVGQKAGDGAAGWQIYRNTEVDPTRVMIRIGASGTIDFSSSTTPTTQQWEHWAVTRQSGTLRWFRNGTLTATHTGVTTDINDTSGGLWIGRSQTWGGYFTGYLDDLRITNGVARYTANFTPPTAAFPNK
jgi:hypothetical protein